MKIFTVLFIILSLSAVSGEFYPLSCGVNGPINYLPKTDMKFWEVDACSVIISPKERELCIGKISKGTYIPANDDTGADAQNLYCQSSDMVSVARCSLVILKAIACPDFAIRSTVQKCANKESAKEQVDCAVAYLAQWQEEEQ